MERRHCQRKNSSRDALLYHPHGFACSCRIDNISALGLFIRTTDTRVHKGSYVDIVVDSSPYMTEPITIKALVVHQMKDGVGLLCEGSSSLRVLYEKLQ